MITMMMMTSAKKEPISMTMNQGRSGGSQYLPNVADNDENGTDIVKKLSQIV